MPSREGAACATACASGEACLDGECHAPAYRIAAGKAHACALAASGELYCWGDNENEQLGDGTRETRPSAVRASGAPGAVSVAAGEDFSCALDKGGQVLCWGAETALHYNESLSDAELEATTAEACARGDKKVCKLREAGKRLEQLAASRKKAGGSNKTIGDWLKEKDAVPRPAKGAKMPSLQDIEEIAAGGTSVCARARTGAVSCFELVAPSSQLSVFVKEEKSFWKPTPVPSLTDATRIGVGTSLGCAIRRSGEVVCWSSEEAPLAVEGIDDAVDLAVGDEHACVLRKSGKVACWGANRSGQLGGQKQDGDRPVEVAGLSGVASIAAGRQSTCARRLDGRVLCWGALGDPRAQGSIVPKEIPGVEKSLQVAVGDGFACAVTSRGEVKCWGSPSHGRLGHGEMPETLSPKEVAGVEDAISVGAGSLGSCALRRNGTVLCWGDSYSAPNKPFTEVTDLKDATAISMRVHTACAVRKGGSAVCWNGRGKPSPAFGGKEVISVASSVNRLCGVLRDGSVSCHSLSTTGPQAVPGLSGLASVEIGGWDWTCGRLRSGGALCWEGLVAPGQPTLAPTKLPVPGISDAVDVAANGLHTCIARKSGKVDCFGSQRKPIVPVSTIGITDAVGVTMSEGSTFWCALRKSGTVVCDGRSNFWGERGDGPLGLRGPRATEVKGVSGAVGVEAGLDHVCAVTGEGKVFCWGNDTHGQVSGRAQGYVESAVTVAGLAL